jgi:hypothetical protein
VAPAVDEAWFVCVTDPVSPASSTRTARVPLPGLSCEADAVASASCAFEFWTAVGSTVARSPIELVGSVVPGAVVDGSATVPGPGSSPVVAALAVVSPGEDEVALFVKRGFG